MYEEVRTHRPKVMPFDVARNAVEFFLGRTDHAPVPLAFSFYGGEPLMEHELIARVIKYIRSVGERQVTFHLTTNGAALNKKRVRDFVAECNMHVTVSVDGPPRIHDALRRTKTGKPTHRMVERGLSLLLSERPGYYRRMIAFNAVLANPEQYPECVAYFNEWPLAMEAREGAVRFTGLDVYDSDSALAAVLSEAAAPASQPCVKYSLRESFVRNRTQVANPGDGLDDYHGDLMVRLAQRREEPLAACVKPGGYCLPGTRKLFVNVDGGLEMCEKTCGAMRIGTLRRGFDLAYILSLLRKLHGMWDSECSHCLAQRFCGNCPAMVATPAGEMSRKRFRRKCVAHRERFVPAVEDFVRIAHTNPDYIKRLQRVIVT